MKWAIGIGALLLAVVVLTLVFQPIIFVLLAGAACGMAQKEMADAFALKDVYLPLPPLVVGGFGILICAYYLGPEAMLAAYLFTVGAVCLWLVADRADNLLKDIVGSAFVSAYVPYLAGFAVLMLAETNGLGALLTFIVMVICSDTGGLAAGVFFGKHPIAPSISPKKSWEGFVGSVLGAGVSGAICLYALGVPWWMGLAMGPLIAITATLGDFAESLLKRDFGLKDMSNLLPGHGGMMDRLDSLLLTAPVAYLILRILVGA